MPPIRLLRADAAAVRAAMRDLRAMRLFSGPAREVRLEMWIALWSRDGSDAPEVRLAIAHLAGMAYLRDRLHAAPTAEISGPVTLDAPKPNASWCGREVGVNCEKKHK